MKIQVCTGKMCKDRFSEYILKRLNNDKKRFNLDNLIIEECPCTGKCKDGPNIVLDGKIESRIEPSKASKLMMDKINNRKNNN